MHRKFFFNSFFFFLRKSKNKEDFVVPTQISSNPLPISDEKKKDLIDLLFIILEIFRDFYKKLPSVSDTRSINYEEDPDLVDIMSDDE